MNVILSIGLLVFTGYILGELAQKNKIAQDFRLYSGRDCFKS